MCVPFAVVVLQLLNVFNCVSFWLLKKSGRCEPFDRDKLMRSVDVAVRKRNIDPDRIERAISGIVRQLEGLGNQRLLQKNWTSCDGSIKKELMILLISVLLLCIEIFVMQAIFTILSMSCQRV